MGFLSWLIGPPLPPPAAKARSAPTVLGTRTLDGRSIVRVTRNTRPYYEEKGWRKVGEELRGHYRTRYKTCEGRIENPFGSDPTFFITSPPERVLDGPHGACFREWRKGVYRVHWQREPEDVNAGIVGIEQIIVEAYACDRD